jgi:hypothetical protein
VSPASGRLPPDGTSLTPVTITVKRGTDPAAGVALNVSTTLGSLGASGTASSATAVTGADGTAVVQFRASATPGVATITAALASVPAVSLSTTVTMPTLGQLRLQLLQHNVMGVKGSGYRETNILRVLATDAEENPYPAGLVVRFEHQKLGESQLSLPAASCSPAAASCVAYQATTDASGIAQVNLSSGMIAGTLSVVAVAPLTGQTYTFPNVAVIGAKANAANFSVVCSPRNIPALAETDCSSSLVDAPFNCVALLKDRYQNVLGTPTQVTFKSEAGAAGPPVTTPPYDPEGGAQPLLGTATQVFQTLGAGLPSDVPPVGAEGGVVWQAEPCPLAGGLLRTHNPRDGIVTIIAIADGEEAFVDKNGNGIYDSGEPFIDLGEPFVDQNDNGQYDPPDAAAGFAGEWFLDTNGDENWNGPNESWDANTKIWTQTVVVYTGLPMSNIPAGGGNLLGTRWANSMPSACTPTAPASFLVHPSQSGPPALPATTDTLYVTASDGNLNLLATAAQYAVQVRGPGKVTATYRGLPSYADDLGFFFRYWPATREATARTSARRRPRPCRVR